MDTKPMERSFVLITSNTDRTYEEECNMAMDVFLEEEFDMDELKRMLLHLLDKVKAGRWEMMKEKVEQRIGSLYGQQLADFVRPPCSSFCGKYVILIASVRWRSDMKKFIRLCGIAACMLLLLTGCSPKYERGDEPRRTENITAAKMQEMVDKKESLAIVFTQTTRSHRIEFKKMLDGYLLDHNVVLYGVVPDEALAPQRKSDLSTIRKTSPGMNETPSLYYVKEGKLGNLPENSDDGLTEEKFDSWVQRRKLDEKK